MREKRGTRGRAEVWEGVGSVLRCIGRECGLEPPAAGAPVLDGATVCGVCGGVQVAVSEACEPLLPGELRRHHMASGLFLSCAYDEEELWLHFILDHDCNV